MDIWDRNRTWIGTGTEHGTDLELELGRDWEKNMVHRTGTELKQNMERGTELRQNMEFGTGTELGWNMEQTWNTSVSWMHQVLLEIYLNSSAKCQSLVDLVGLARSR